VAPVLRTPPEVHDHEVVSRELPSGTVTFLFTDIEGSTRLLHELGADAYAQALSEHRRVLRAAFAAHGGVEVNSQGDAFFVAFGSASNAVAAAWAAQGALALGPIRVRMGLHTGTAKLAEDGYVGADVHLGARIAAAGYGGQVLLSKATRELVDVEISDLGEHRLKDFAGPVWLFQLGSERFPPLKTISNTNLPRPASSFVGRERELADVTSLLQHARLLTLTGPGGSGKTRLAIEAAAELVPEFKGGVFWLGLAGLRDPALVIETIAQMLGAREAVALAEHIGDRELLLLLDNLEHVIEAAPDLAQLVEACPKLTLLVTSRELLRARGEVEYAVPPLSEPEAVELFCARAHTQADETIAELCRRLDNLPLGVELAAARARLLSPQQILDRLAQRLDLLKGGRGAEARQRTLRTAIDWSHELLSAEEQGLFRRLAVFAGGCTLQAAQELAHADLDTLQSLVDKSLLRRTVDRFWMLGTIRDYAAERLAESDEAEALGGRYVEHFLALAEEAEPHLRTTGIGAAEWVDRLDREHDNIRSALDRIEASGETQLALRLAGAVWWFWVTRNHLAEGRRRLDGFLRADERPTPARAKALIAASGMAIEEGDVAAGREWGTQAVTLNRELGDPWSIGWATCLLGWAIQDEGDFEGARPFLDESARLLRDVGDDESTLWAIHLLAWNHFGLGEVERARDLWEENLERARATGNRHVEALSLGVLARNFALDEGRVDDALSMLKEAYRLHRDLDMPPMQTAFDLNRLADGLVAAGKPVAATRALASAEKLLEESDARARPVIAEGVEQTIAAIRAQLDESAFREEWAEGRDLTPDEAVEFALGELN
jgi:predicted ATPase/class 3 adenylate cyclase